MERYSFEERLLKKKITKRIRGTIATKINPISQFRIKEMIKAPKIIKGARTINRIKINTPCWT